MEAYTYTSYIDMMICTCDRMTITILNAQTFSCEDHQVSHMWLKPHPTGTKCPNPASLTVERPALCCLR